VELVEPAVADKGVGSGLAGVPSQAVRQSLRCGCTTATSVSPVTRDSYNSVRKQLPDKAKPEAIIALLRMLEDNKFVYTTRFEVEKDLTRKPVSRKLV
jgi:hypothetical protein